MANEILKLKLKKKDSQNLTSDCEWRQFPLPQLPADALEDELLSSETSWLKYQGLAQSICYHRQDTMGYVNIGTFIRLIKIMFDQIRHGFRMNLYPLLD